jgi:hypothetical protein
MTWEKVRITSQSDATIGMAEPLADDFNGHARKQQMGGMGMAKIMNLPTAHEARILTNTGHIAVEVGRVEEGTVAGREYKFADIPIVVSHWIPEGDFAMVPERRDAPFIYVHRSQGRHTFWRVKRGPDGAIIAVEQADALADTESAPVEIEVTPPQP